VRRLCLRPPRSILGDLLWVVVLANTLSGFGNARKSKIFLLEMDNYYDVQKFKEDDKVSIIMTIFVVYLSIRNVLNTMGKKGTRGDTRNL
jgi:hypothetical protein